MAADLLGHPHAAVLDLDPHHPVPHEATQVDVASLRHGVHSVEDQVGEDLAQLGRVAQHRRDFLAVQAHLDLDVAPLGLGLPAGARDLHRVGQDPGQLHGLERTVGADPRELLDAPDRLPAVAGRPFDDGHLPVLALGEIPPAQELDASQDGAQQVVEIVGHAAGQLSQRPQPLGVLQLGPQPLGFGGVDQQALRRRSAQVLDAASPQLELARHSLGIPGHDLHGRRRLAPLPVRDALDRELGRPFLENALQAEVGTQRLLLRNGEGHLEDAVDEADPPVLHDEDRVRGMLDEDAVLGLGLFQGAGALAVHRPGLVTEFVSQSAYLTDALLAQPRVSRQRARDGARRDADALSNVPYGDRSLLAHVSSVVQQVRSDNSHGKESRIPRRNRKALYCKHFQNPRMPRARMMRNKCA